MSTISADYKDFTQGSIFKQLITFSAPLFFSNLLQAIYNIVDMIIVGQVVGKAGLSAVSVGGDITNFLNFIAIGFSSAGQVIIAQNIGAGNKDDLNKIIGNLFSFLLGLSVILSAVCFQFRMYFLDWMNTPYESYEMAGQYITVCIAGLFFIYGYNAISAVLRGLGDAKHPFIFVATAAVLNMILDLIFIMGFDLGAFGAALATVIGQGVSFIYGMIFLLKNHHKLGLDLTAKSFIPGKKYLGPLLALGIPMAIKNAAVTFSKIFLNAWVNANGVIASSVAGIYSKMNTITNLVSNSINASCATIIGQNFGKENYQRIPKILRCAFLMILSVDFCLACVTFFFPGILFGMFTSDEEVLTTALIIVPVLLISYAGSSLRCPFNALINGSGNSRLNFIVAILDGIVLRIGLAALLGNVLDIGWSGYLYGDALAGFTPFIIGGAWFISGKWKTNKFLLKNKD